MLNDYFQYDYYNNTSIHPIGLTVLIILGIIIMTTEKKKMVLPIILVSLFIPNAQRISIAGLDFTLLRVLILLGWIRLIAKKEFTGHDWNTCDKIIVIWAIIKAIIYIIRNGDFSAIVYQSGRIFDIFGLYFMFRHLISDIKDIHRIIKYFAYCSVIISVFFLIERVTARNLFSIFGGVPEITIIREGRLRCQGAFSHPIVAGCFWALMLPLYIACFWEKTISNRILFAGIISSLLIIFTTSSSTPIVSVGLVFVGFCFYPLRNNMRLVRRVIVISFISLILIMKAPPWHLISRIDLAGGSTGWHRFALIDGAINNLDNWIWIGTQSTSSWGQWLIDITNQYILEGIDGGISAVILFVLIIITVFKYTGKLRIFYQNTKKLEIFMWSLCVIMFVHVINYIVLTYFGQLNMLWYLYLAACSSLYTNTFLKKEALPYKSTDYQVV